MSSNVNEDPWHNSTEKHVLKEIEKKVHNLDHNETVNNMDENEEFFDTDCSIPDERSMKETGASGKEPSPNKDNTTLENDNASGNKQQNDSILELDVIENESNEKNFTNFVDDTDNLASKNNVFDDTIQVQVEKIPEVCTTRDIKEEIIKKSLSKRVGGTITLDASNNPDKHTNNNIDIVLNVGTNNKQFTNTATTIDPPNIDDSKDDKSELTELSWLLDTPKVIDNNATKSSKDKTSNETKKLQSSINSVTNESNNDSRKDCTDDDIVTVKFSLPINHNEIEEEDTDTAETLGASLIKKPPTLPKMFQFEPTTPHRGISSHGGKQVLIPPPGCELVIPPSATIAGGSSSKIYLEDVVNEVSNKKNLKDQRGLLNCSGLFCPNIYLYEHYTVKEKMTSFDNEKGSYALGKIVEVPNAKKMIETYTIKYDDIHDKMDGWVTKLPRNKFVKEYLQQGIVRANKVHWRLVTKKRVTKQKNKKPSKKPPSQNSTDLLSGILEEDHQSSCDKVTEDDSADRDYVPTDPSYDGDITSVSRSHVTKHCKCANGVTTDNSTSSTSSDEDDISWCGMEDSAYVEQTTIIPAEISFNKEGNNMSLSKEEDDHPNEKTYLWNDWTWNSWEKHNIDDAIPGPEEHDRYKGPHGLKPNVSKRFCTVLQCLFETTSMNRKFFLQVAGESNNYARKIMKERNTTLFLGHKWSNISVEEMVHFFGILLQISLEPCKMEGDGSYFVENQSLTLASGYTASLRGYNAWAKDIMSLVRFKQIRSAFRSECHQYDINDKCYQLRWFIGHFNYMAKKTFDLGPNASFDEGGIAMRSRFCPVCQYNKDKPAKYCVDFFILADSQHYFIYHLDVYQGANQANIDIHPSIKHLPMTQKAVANAILKSGIDNDKDGCRYLFMDNRYAAPQLLALMLTNYNIRAVGTYKANRVGFESEALKTPSNSKRGDYVRLVDKRLGMVITRWKASNCFNCHEEWM